MTTTMQEYTLLNCVAHDHVRRAAQQKGEIAPCWLTLADEYKDQARREVLQIINRMFHKVNQGFVGQTTSLQLDADDPQVDENLAKAIGGRLDDQLNAWRQAEEHYRQLRELGDPTAYFSK